MFNHGGGTGIRALIRNEEGILRGALSRRLPNPYTPLVVECIMVREGLCLARLLGLLRVDVESDSLFVVQAIAFDNFGEIESIIDDSKCLLLELGSGSCGYIPRLCNVTSHTLAQSSITATSDVSWSLPCPPCIVQIVVADALN